MHITNFIKTKIPF